MGKWTFGALALYLHLATQARLQDLVPGYVVATYVGAVHVGHASLEGYVAVESALTRPAASTYVGS